MSRAAMNRMPRFAAAMTGLVLMLLSIVCPAGPSLVGDARAADDPPNGSTEAAVRQYSDAAALYNRMVFDLAADEWSKFLAKYPQDPLASKARHYLGICLLEQKKYGEAREALEAVVSQDPKFELLESTLLNLGLADYGLAQAGQNAAYDDAAAALGQLITNFPSSKNMPQALYYRGEALDARGKKEA